MSNTFNITIMKKNELRPVIAQCYHAIEKRWSNLAKEFEDPEWDFENFNNNLLKEPNSQMTKMVCWLYALDKTLDSSEKATPFEIEVMSKLPKIIETLDDLAEDHDTF